MCCCSRKQLLKKLRSAAADASYELVLILIYLRKLKGIRYFKKVICSFFRKCMMLNRQTGTVRRWCSKLVAHSFFCICSQLAAQSSQLFLYLLKAHSFFLYCANEILICIPALVFVIGGAVEIFGSTLLCSK